MFYLVHLLPHGEEPLDQFGTFEDGKAAARKAKDLASLSVYKIQPRRLAQAADWRPRELALIERGMVTPLPPNWDLEPVADHYARLVGDEREMIGYFANEADAVLNKITRQNPGRYLAQFHPQLSDLERKRYIAMVDGGSELFFANTPDEFEWVYLNGPPSCMAKPKSRWFGNRRNVEHPVRAYAAGDLAIAYLKKSTNRVSARALVWPEKKIIGRLYGDEQRLLGRLQDEGYRLERGAFNGVKVRKIPFEKGDNPTVFVMPYFDDMTTLVDEGDHFVSIEGRYNIIPHDKMVVGGSESEGTTNLKRFCPRANIWRDADDFIFVKGADAWWSDTAVANFAKRCTATNELYDRDAMICIERKWYGRENAPPHATCAHSGENILQSNAVTASNGDTVAKRCLALHEGILSRADQIRAYRDPASGRFASPHHSTAF